MAIFIFADLKNHIICIEVITHFLLECVFFFFPVTQFLGLQIVKCDVCCSVMLESNLTFSNVSV